MTITAENIATDLNADLQRGETATTLITPIRRALADLSKRAKWPDLHTSSATALVSGVTFISPPADLCFFDNITVNDGTNESKPLRRKTWDDYLTDVSGTGTSGKPDRYTPHGGKTYLYPTANASFTVTTWYYKLHPDHTSSGIVFGDGFRDAIAFGTEVFYLASKGLEKDPLYADATNRYNVALSAVMVVADHEPRVIQYNSMYDSGDSRW